MLQLFFTACTMVGVCQEVRQTYQSTDVTLFQCMLYGQSEMAKWMELHPGYYLVGRWSCGKPDVSL